MSLRCVSYGGGVQSTALLVLAAEGRIDFPLVLFANTGDDSENPATLRYVRATAMPYAEVHGVELLELRHPTETLLGRALDDRRSFPLPMFGEGGMPMTRACTDHFKVRVVDRELRSRGASAADPATVAIGISVDEIERAKAPGVNSWCRSQYRVYPLLDLGLHRSDCRKVVSEAGLPVPPKSSCFFCPFHDREAWRQLKRETPDLFAKSAEIERQYQEKLHRYGKRRQWLTRHGRPLADVVDDQQRLFGDDCDSGWCMT
jgi:3'-phosphoadenosine 5'-phosphosulfate sulfotransferase (PAPS reductase)/FAD synthetase